MIKAYNTLSAVLKVCDELNDAEQKIDVENIIKTVIDVSDVDIEIRNSLHSAKKDAIKKL